MNKNNETDPISKSDWILFVGISCVIMFACIGLYTVIIDFIHYEYSEDGSTTYTYASIATSTLSPVDHLTESDCSDGSQIFTFFPDEASSSCDAEVKRNQTEYRKEKTEKISYCRYERSFPVKMDEEEWEICHELLDEHQSPSSLNTDEVVISNEGTVMGSMTTGYDSNGLYYEGGSGAINQNQ